MQLRLDRIGIRLYGIRKFFVLFLLDLGKRIEIRKNAFAYFIHRFAKIRFERIDVFARRFEPRKLICQIFFIRAELRIDRVERVGLLLFALFRRFVNRFGERFVEIRKFRFRLRAEFFDLLVHEPYLFGKLGPCAVGSALRFIAGGAKLFDRAFGIVHGIVRTARNFDKRFRKRCFKCVDFMLDLRLIFFQALSRCCGEFFECGFFLFVGR